MPSSDLIRDSTFGQLVNYFSNGKLLPYPEQRPGYVVPDKYLLRPAPSTDSSSQTLCGDESTPKSDLPKSTSTSSSDLKRQQEIGGIGGVDGVAANVEKPDPNVDLEKAISRQVANGVDLKTAVDQEIAKAGTTPYLVEWEENDQDNPQNWSEKKRYYVASCIMLLTFAVYCGSAIYTSSIPDLVVSFGVSQTMATLGLTLYVLGYGMGPMIISPLQEMPFVGRLPPYMVGLALLVIFQAPILVGPNFNTILAFRFLGAFFASAALATGGASMGDIFPPHKIPYAISAWAIGAVCGPVAGPVVSGFAAQANGWRWPMYELLWIAGFALLVLFFTFPETLGSTILVRRAERLRKLTGNHLIRTQSEIDAKEGNTFIGELAENTLNAFRLSLEPAIVVGHIYIALVYAIFYLWFEAFPLVFTEIYHFNLGESALPFLGFMVTAIFTLAFYFWYNRYHLEPRYAKNPDLPPEVRLELAIGAGFIVPISLFIFGWTSRANVHWIGPVIGASLYLPGVFLLFQSVLIYITMGFPKHAASILAGNDLFRSSIASVFPLFGAHFFRVLGIGGGSSLLAGLSILMIPLMWLIHRYGAQLRARSKWTDDTQIPQ